MRSLSIIGPLTLVLSCIEAEIVQVSIPEEVSVGTLVARLLYSGEYSLYDVNEPYFHLSFDGTITTKSRIDREVEPFNNPNEPYELKIRHSQTLIQVLINVIDINDNKPLFKVKQESFAFSENAQVGDEKTLPEAIDTDYGINSTQGYRIKSGNTDNTFQIVSFKAGPRKFYYLRLKRMLDREQESEYSLVIEAYDGAYPPRVDLLEVHVLVEDENDCNPEFNQTQYFASVREDANIGTRIIQVAAADGDSGANSRLVYAIDREFNGDNKFMVKKYTGDIILQGQLDYELEKEVFLMVIASDEGVYPRSAKVYVRVSVLDVNDNQPHIEIIYKSATDTEAEVDEDSERGSQVVSIRVTDADSGEAGRVTCSMSSERGGEYFKLYHNDEISDMWNVNVERAPRREIASEYTLSITCHDNGSPEQKISFMTFKVKIMDVNNHWPSFDPPTYSISIPENTPPGTEIITVAATDGDDGEFGEVTYRITTVSAQDTSTDPLLWFQISPKGGVIRNLLKLDRELTPDITLTIQAVDGGIAPEGPKVASTTVTLRLLDENDNTPLFSQELIEANIKNNVPVGTEVAQVRARDFDDGSFGAVEYALDPVSENLRIQRTTGQITVSNPFRLEDYQVVSLHVVATDGGGLQGRCEVRVSIFGDNLYPPELDQQEYSVSVAESVLPPHTLLTIAASDQDPTYFGEVHYELQGSTDNKFAVDRDTGLLRVIKPLDYETRRQYTFEVRAFNNYDGTSDRKEDRAQITVFVNDVNDEPPKFHLERYNLTAFAEDANGTIIGIIRAVDPDSGGESGRITYRIVGGNQQRLFKLRSTQQGAEIHINGNLRYMVGKEVNLVLEAQDDNQDRFNGHQTVLWITVLEGIGPGFFNVANRSTWFDNNLPVIIGAAVIVSLVFVVVIVVVCNRANRQRKLQYSPAKLPAFDGYEYADLDEQYGLEPDTVKAYNIDGGGECDRLSAFEALTNQLQSLQQDYVMTDKNFGGYPGYAGGYPSDSKVQKSHIDSEGYFSLSDPAFGDNQHDKGQQNGSSALNTLLNNHNIYSNLPGPPKCDTSKYVPLSPPPERGDLMAAPPGADRQDFVRSLPPRDNAFLPMSPPEVSPPPLSEDEDEDEEEGSVAPRPPERVTSLSSLVSSQSRPSEISRLPTSLLSHQDLPTSLLSHQDELLVSRDRGMNSCSDSTDF